jgi:hypothetical protein
LINPWARNLPPPVRGKPPRTRAWPQPTPPPVNTYLGLGRCVHAPLLQSSYAANNTPMPTRGVCSFKMRVTERYLSRERHHPLRGILLTVLKTG